MSPTDAIIAERPEAEQPAPTDRPVVNTRFGDFTYDPARIIAMPQGPIGYADRHSFVFLNVPGAEDGPYKIFQSIDDPSLGFIVIPAATVDAPIEHADKLAACNYYHVAWESAAFILIAVMRRDENGQARTTVNLKAPLLVDVDNLWANQVVFTNNAYSVTAEIQ
ncbi:Flagellar assembly factor FliW [Limimonas halophila]|uniref:Flagellar assembly factor FliW n=1 Tax=Limimonas halophila TaxID=1082479 RepID=A0A1G7Q4Z4_9PROT|nr:flagellar assembly protein FliW [Limimonas halophila]SDF93576.1 Flagellar assembly factor FliW [Limimonas halophila]